jgi:mRNA-degrading endonuclease RelE of RelBE toxin-antitoxin system
MAVVKLTPEAAEQAGELPRPIRQRLIGLVERLESWPEVSGTKPLSGKLAGRFRMRTGDYRIQFRVDGETVIIERIGHRDGFYGD